VPATRTSPTSFAVVIAGKAVSGRSLQYHLEARDASGAIVGTAGSADSPAVLLVKSPDGANGEPSVETSRPKARTASRKAPSDEDPLAGVAAERRQAQRAARLHRREGGAMFAGLALGSGYGWHPRAPLELRRDLDVQPGLNTGGDFHVLPEVGYQLSDDLALSLQVRVQIIQSRGSGDPTAGKPARGAVAAIARAQWFFGDDNTRFVASGNVGAGDAFRLVVPPRTDGDANTALPRHDTIRGGPLVLGPGAGVIHHFTSAIAAGAEIRTLVGAPNFAVVFDVGAGLQVGF
jgi:hypothetical protein